MNAVSEDRIAALEKIINDLGALVNGLTQEYLDLKSIDLEMARKNEEYNRRDLKRIQLGVQCSEVPGAIPDESVPQEECGSTIILNTGDRMADAEPPAPVERSGAMIMQTDGTKKLEPRRGNYIVASPGDGRSKKRQ